MTRTSAALDRLRAADPLAARTDLDTATPRRRHRGRLAVSVVAVAAAAAVAFVLLPGGAVQPSDARAVESLLAASRAAAAAVDAPLRPGQLVYSRTQHEYTNSILSSAGRVEAVYFEGSTTDESWIARNGATTRLQVPSEQRTYPTPRDENVVRGRHIPPETRHVDRIAAYAGSVNAPTYDFARTLPTDPAALEQRIRQDTAGAGESADAEVWVTVRDMLLSPISPPALRAALYQVAASLPGVEYLGTTTDRLGRSGVAVALPHGDATHARTREVMIFDPKTGLLLESAQIALDPAQYGLPASMKGAVVEWDLWVQSGVVDGIGVRPDASRADLSD